MLIKNYKNFVFVLIIKYGFYYVNFFEGCCYSLKLGKKIYNVDKYVWGIIYVDRIKKEKIRIRDIKVVYGIW